MQLKRQEAPPLPLWFFAFYGELLVWTVEADRGHCFKYSSGFLRVYGIPQSKVATSFTNLETQNQHLRQGHDLSEVVL